MKRKLIIVACILATCLSLIALTSCCNDEKTEKDYSSINFIALGDSIAEGILGPTPLIEKENYTYCSVVGQVNGFTYRNRAVSGHRSDQMLDHIFKEKDDDAYATIANIKKANVIVVSVLGNDLLRNNFSQFLEDAVNNNFEEVDEILSDSYKNLDGIVKRLKELNPDALLIFQTVYNPLCANSNIINPEVRKTLIEKYEFDDDKFYDLGAIMLNRLNHTFYEYLRVNPNKFIIADVNAKFDRLYRADKSNLEKLLYADFIHPSARGHAVIASVIQDILEDTGIVERGHALKSYKEFRIKQLGTLYAQTGVNIRKVKNEINKAKNFNEINDAYFDGVEGVTPREGISTINAVDRASETYFETEKAFKGNAVSLLENTLLKLAFDVKKSSAVFNTDGTFELKIAASQLLNELIKSAVSSGQYATLVDTVLEWAQPFTDELFPGEKLTDIAKSFERVKKEMGLSFEGFDMDNEEIKSIFDELKSTGKFPENASLPDDFEFSVKLKGHYSIHEDISEDGANRKALYVGPYTEHGDTYAILTYYEDYNGKECVRFNNYIVRFDILFAMD